MVQAVCFATQVFVMKELKRDPLVLICAGLLIGIGAGIVVSILLFPSNRDEHVPNTNTPIDESSDSELSNKPPNQQIDLTSVLELDVATDRRLAVYGLLEGLSAEAITDLVKHSFTLDSAEHLVSIQGLLFSELAHVVPKLSLELVWERPLAQQYEFFTIAITEWASTRPEAAMQFASTLAEPWKSHAFRNILQTQRDHSDEELAEKFGASAILTELSYKSRLEDVIDEPRVAFELALSADVPESQRAEMISLTTERWLNDGSTNSITWMLDLVHEVFAEERYQWRTVIAKLAASNPRFVWDELSTMSLDVQKRFNDEVFAAWVEQSPIEAIEVLNYSDYMSAETYELPSLYSQWARFNSDDLLDHITLIPEDYRAGALRSATRHMADKLSSTEILTRLDQFKSMGIKTKEATDAFLRIWTQREPEQALVWIEQNFDEGTFERDWKVRDVLQQLARKDAVSAMEVALQQPVDSNAAHTVIGELLRMGRLDQSMAMLSSVPEGSGLAGTYSYVACFLIAAGRASDAMELADRLEQQQKFSFFHSLIESGWIISIEDRIAILRGMNNDEMRSRVAATFLRLNEFNEELTSKEEELIRSYVHAETD